MAATHEGQAAAAETKEKVDYEIQILNAEKHGQGMSAYLTYEVRTKAKGGPFKEGKEMSVRRRWADFVWLRHALVKQFPSALVPPLPEKERLTQHLGQPHQQLEAHSHTHQRQWQEAQQEQLQQEEVLLHRRCGLLSSFLHRVTQHPLLASSEDLATFVEARLWGMSNESSQTVSTGQMGQYLLSLGKEADTTWKKLKVTLAAADAEDPEHERHQNLLSFTNTLEANLLKLLESSKKVHKRHEGIGQDLSEAVAALDAMSQTDDELSHALRNLSEGVGRLSRAWVAQSHMDQMEMSEPLKDVVLLSGAARTVLQHRQAQVQRTLELKAYQAEEGLRNPKPKSALDLFKETLTLESPKDQVRGLQLKQLENEKALTAANRQLEDATKSTAEEMERFHKMRVLETKALLVNYAQSQAAFHKRMARIWDEMLPALEGVQVCADEDVATAAAFASD